MDFGCCAYIIDFNANAVFVPNYHTDPHRLDFYFALRYFKNQEGSFGTMVGDWRLGSSNIQAAALPHWSLTPPTSTWPLHICWATGDYNIGHLNILQSHMGWLTFWIAWKELRFSQMAKAAGVETASETSIADTHYVCSRFLDSLFLRSVKQQYYVLYTRNPPISTAQVYNKFRRLVLCK